MCVITINHTPRDAWVDIILLKRYINLFLLFFNYFEILSIYYVNFSINSYIFFLNIIMDEFQIIYFDPFKSNLMNLNFKK